MGGEAVSEGMDAPKELAIDKICAMLSGSFKIAPSCASKPSVSITYLF